MNVLITSASRKVELVRAFRKALAEFGGGRVIAADISSLSPALYVADAAHIVRRSDDPQFVDEMLDYCLRQNIGLLVPTRDEELPVFAEAKPKFGNCGVSIMVADPDVIKICQDKLLFASFCASQQFDTARVFGSPDEVGQDDFPLFVRGRVGKSSRSAFRVDSRRHLQYISEIVPESLIQEFIGWSEYTIDLFADFRGRVISVVPRERIMVVGGESYISRTVKSCRLIDEAVRLAERLKLVGHNTIQCFFDGAAVKFIEVNPRFGGAAGLGFAAGACTPLFLLRACRGEELQPVIGEFVDGLTMLRYTQDIYMAGDQLKTGEQRD